MKMKTWLKKHLNVIIIVLIVAAALLLSFFRGGNYPGGDKDNDKNSFVFSENDGADADFTDDLTKDDESSSEDRETADESGVDGVNGTDNKNGNENSNENVDDSDLSELSNSGESEHSEEKNDAVSGNISDKEDENTNSSESGQTSAQTPSVTPSTENPQTPPQTNNELNSGTSENNTQTPEQTKEPDETVNTAEQQKNPQETSNTEESSHPAPVDPENAEISDVALSCTLTVKCDTLLDNLEFLDSEKTELVPEDGVIYQAKNVTFYEGESVFNVLSRELKVNKIHFEFVNTPAYNSAYIEGIGNLYEYDCGELSGWMYKVNGWFPNYGCSRYKLEDGDVVEIVYTCDLGADVGGEYSAKNGYTGDAAE